MFTNLSCPNENKARKILELGGATIIIDVYNMCI